MTETRKSALKALERNMKSRETYELQPIAKTGSNVKMPHEKDVEIGERILRKKIFSKL